MTKLRKLLGATAALMMLGGVAVASTPAEDHSVFEELPQCFYDGQCLCLDWDGGYLCFGNVY